MIDVLVVQIVVSGHQTRQNVTSQNEESIREQWRENFNCRFRFRSVERRHIEVDQLAGWELERYFCIKEATVEK